MKNELTWPFWRSHTQTWKTQKKHVKTKMLQYVSNAAEDMYSHIKQLDSATAALLPSLAVWHQRVIQYEANQSELVGGTL